MNILEKEYWFFPLSKILKQIFSPCQSDATSDNPIHLESSPAISSGERSVSDIPIRSSQLVSTRNLSSKEHWPSRDERVRISLVCWPLHRLQNRLRISAQNGSIRRAGVQPARPWTDRCSWNTRIYILI